MKTILLLYFVLVCLPILAEPNIAFVKLIKGNATKLLPGELDSKPVKKNDKFPEDTSIATKVNSIVKISFYDGSSIVIGPKSHAVIRRMNKQGNGVVNLLVGKIRTEVIKNKEKKKKFFVNTRSAALGVRGTDFQTIYNIENKTTSVVTFEGKVAMNKIDEKKVQEIYNRITEDKGNINIDEILDKTTEVEVTPGKYSGVVENLPKPTIPVKISPVQFKALKQTDEFNPDVLKINANEEIKITETLAVNEPPPEGFYDKKTGDFAPKAGGFVDLNTGFYIPPENNAKFDKKQNVFLPSKAVGVIAKNGAYIPPVGLVLDAKKGFIIDESENEKTKADVKKLQSSLNQKMAYAMPSEIPDKEKTTEIKKEVAKKDEQKIPDRKAWFGKNHRFYAGLGPIFETIGIDSKSYSDVEKNSQFDLSNENSMKIDLLWEFDIFNSLKLNLRAHLGSDGELIDESDKNNEKRSIENIYHENQNETENFTAEIMYKSSKTFLYKGVAKLLNVNILVKEDNFNPQGNMLLTYPVELSLLGLGVRKYLKKDVKKIFYFDFDLGMSLGSKNKVEKDEGGNFVNFDIDITTGYFFHGKLNYDYKYFKNWGFSAKLNFTYLEHSTQIISFDENNNSPDPLKREYDISRMRWGVTLGIFYDL